MKKGDIILLDVEGTVAPISFVVDVMFPFAAQEMESFVSDHWDELQDIVADFRSLSEADQDAGIADCVPVAGAGSSRGEQIESVIANALWQMSQDRKSTPLKALQGRIWKGGFESGILQSVVFADVKAAMEDWKEAGMDIAIYSSGSVQAQKLFFRYCEVGDLSPLLNGHFDTRVGAKRSPESYRAIAEELNCSAERIVFFTDVVQEADAAVAAGMRAVVMNRPGNAPMGIHDHPVWEDFTQWRAASQ